MVTWQHSNIFITAVLLRELYVGHRNGDWFVYGFFAKCI